MEPASKRHAAGSGASQKRTGSGKPIRKRGTTIHAWIAATGRLFLLFSALAISSSAFAQEFRGTISGSVLDPSGAVVPGATVEVQEMTTGAINRTVSDAAGQYVVPFLLPGSYTVTVHASGFEVLTRTGITLQAQEHPIIDLRLRVGTANQSVTVSGATPLLSQSSATISDVISTASVADLPLNGRAPMMLAELSVGVETEAAPQISHPFDNNNMNSFSIAGTPLQSSEVLLDGSPDETMLGSLAFSPTQDSVQEVSVQPFATDASFGHTIGGVMNQITRSGTNSLHGTAYEFNQIPDLYANTYFDDRNTPVTPLPNTHYNQYGLTAGGPVWIPKVLNGRNKLFWFFAFEGLKDKTPATVLETVPTPAEAEGDFSALLAQGANFQLYEPMTGSYSGGKTSNRTPIPSNCLTNQSTYCASVPNAGYTINPIALNYLKLFPPPTPGVTPGQDGTDNYISNAPSVDDYNEEFGRMDFNLSAKDHMFFDFRANYRSQIKEDYFGNNTNGSTLVRQNWGSTFDNVYTLNPSTVFDVRLNWTLFYEAHDSPASVYTPTQMGFPSSLESGSPYVELPVIKFNSGSFLGFNTVAGPGYDPTTSYQLFADVLKTIGNHSLKVGFDGRQYRMRIRNYDASGSPSGSFSFGNNWMSEGTSNPAPTFGADLASFELGLATTGNDSFDLESEADYHTYYVGLFAQDDWRVTPRLTLNLGVRYDVDTPYDEKFGRTIDGFNPTASNNASGATYDSSDTATVNGTTVAVNPSTFNTLGGLAFPSGSGGAPFQIADNKGFFSPRIGFSYNPAWFKNSMVVRGGFAMFVQPQTLLSLPANDNPSSSALTFASGFSASTTYNSSNNSYFNDCTSGETTSNTCPSGDTPLTLGNPYPGGITQPAGSSAGASTFLGESISFFAPNEHDAFSERWNLGVQHQISPSTLVEAIYVGNHALHTDVNVQNINTIEKQYLTTNPYPDYDLATVLGTAVPNPFYNLLPPPASSSFDKSTIPLQDLLVPYPQFGNSAINEYNETIGQSWYHAGMLHLEQRTRAGLTLTANYNFSKLIERDTRLNDEDNFLTKRVSPFDHTHHFTTGGTYNLPFGRGKKFEFGGSRLADELLGGFVLNGIYQFESGPPIYFSGDIPFIPGQGMADIKSQPRNTNPAKGADGTPALVNAWQVFATGSQSGYAKGTTTCVLSACNGTVSSYNPSAVPTGTQTQADAIAASTDASYTAHYRTLPQTFGNVREDGYNNLDASILKNFPIKGESTYFQLRFETFNTLNHPVFAAPNLTTGNSNFGYITSVTSNSQSRQIQLGGRLVF
jgi:hypothetical protein